MKRISLAARVVIGGSASLLLWAGGMFLGASFTPQRIISTEFAGLLLACGLIMASYALKHAPFRWLGMPSCWLSGIVFAYGQYVNDGKIIWSGGALAALVLFAVVSPEGGRLRNALRNSVKIEENTSTPDGAD